MTSAYTPIIPTAEPFLFKGGDTGILLVHGFTGTPKEMRWMGEYLAEQGHTVMGIRLAGHATHPSDLPHIRWLDWLHSVADGFSMLSSCTSQVFLMGLSMGGVLCLLSAANLPAMGVIAMSTPFALPDDPRLPYARLFAWIKPSMPKGPPDWHDLSAAQEHIDYPTYPTRGIAELRELLIAMRQALPYVEQPVLLIHSKQDTGVIPENMHQIYEQLGSNDKTMEWVDNSGHVITREPQRQHVFHLAAQFVARITAAGHEH